MPIGLSNGSDLGHRCVTHERVLDQCGIDVVATANDEFLGAAAEREMALRIETAEISGVQPPLSQPDAAVVGLPQIAREDVRTLDADDADLGWADLADRAQVRVDAEHTKFLVRQPDTDAAELPF